MFHDKITRYPHGLSIPNEVIHFDENHAWGKIRIKTGDCIYEIEKEDVGHLDPNFEKAQSEKFLIFHRIGLNFGHQTKILEESKLGQPLEQKMVYMKVRADPNPNTWIFFDKNKETKIRLNPATKPLDLIYDNPAILKYDYQVLNSGGS